ncbi:UNVERIFIED_CONTAM: hypothetical protein FKN15_030473 [Acipenser sinensis]
MKSSVRTESIMGKGGEGMRPGMPSGARMPHQGAPMGPPGPPYGGSPSVRPGMPNTVMEPTRKRPASSQQVQQQQAAQNRARNAKRRKMADKILPQRIRELVPESQAYMDLLAFERKLDQTIMRKRVDIQEALKRPMKLKQYKENLYRNLQCFNYQTRLTLITLSLSPTLDCVDGLYRTVADFLLVMLDVLCNSMARPAGEQQGISSSVCVLFLQWHRTPTTQETDGFQVKRPGDVSVRCTLLLMLDYQIFDCPRLKFSEIPQRLTNLLLPPDPIVINHVISVDPNDQKKTACYDIDVEVEDPLKGQMSSFLLSTANQQEIASLDNKIHETIESINQLKIQRDFMLSFSKDPKGYIQDWLKSQSRDLKVMTDVVGNPEEERRAEFYQQPWSQEAVNRYFYCKVTLLPCISPLTHHIHSQTKKIGTLCL